MADTMRDVLLEALLNLTTSLELSDDELVDPGFVSDVLGDVVSDLNRLGETDRALLAKLIGHRAAVETNPRRREVLAESPEALGLLDEPE